MNPTEPPPPRDGSPGSAPRSMAQFRHDLLTPVNHILGYAELLVEEAEDSGRDDILPGLRAILDEGRGILEFLRGALDDGLAIPAGFPAEVARLCGRIIEGCDRLAPTAGASRPDLLKVRGAADSLIVLTAGPGSGPLRG